MKQILSLMLMCLSASVLAVPYGSVKATISKSQWRVVADPMDDGPAQYHLEIRSNDFQMDFNYHGCWSLQECMEVGRALDGMLDTSSRHMLFQIDRKTHTYQAAYCWVDYQLASPLIVKGKAITFSAVKVELEHCSWIQAEFPLRCSRISDFIMKNREGRWQCYRSREIH